MYNLQGAYSVTVEKSGCQSEEEVYVLFDPYVLDLGPDILSCHDTTIYLEVELGAVQYFWSTGANTNSITITETGDYFVDVLTNDGCSLSDSISIANVDISIAVPDSVVICNVQSITINGGDDSFDYTWEGPSNFLANGTEITIQEAGSYSVTVTHPQYSDCIVTKDFIVFDSNIDLNFDLGPDQVFL